MRWRLEDVTLDPARCELRRGAARVALEPRVADVLRHLLENAGRVVPRTELLAAVWPDAVVTESSLARAVSLLRRSLRQVGAPDTALRTIPRRGYLVDAAAIAETADEPEPAAASDPTFVGRDRELAVLLGMLEAARDGRGSAAVVVGEGGIGKTSLLRELAARAGPGVWVLRAACRGAFEPGEFAPWIALLSSLDERRRARRAGSAVRDLAALLPGFVGAGGGGDPEVARRALFAGVSRTLRDAARAHPLLLLLDDLHLAEASSALLAAEVASELGGSRVLLVAAHRPLHERGTPLASALERLARAGRRLELQGFTDAEVARFVARSGARETPADVVAAIARRSGGSPLFVRELLWLHASGAPPQQVPATLAHAIRERVEGLPEPTLTLLARAAAIGPEFALALLARASRSDAGRVLEELGPAEARGVVAPLAEDPMRFAFAHELVRDALYAELSSARRAALHGEIAEALEAICAGSDPPWSELARHHAEARTPEHASRASECAARAAQRALDRLAFEDAAAHYRDALRLLEAAGAPVPVEPRCALLVGLGDACYHAADADAATEAYEEAVRLARGGGAVEAMAIAAVRLTHRQRGNVGAVPHARLAILEEVLARLPDGDGELRASALTALGTDLAWADDARARALSAASLAMARRLGRRDLVLRAITSRAQLLLRPEDAAERNALAAEELALARALGDGVDELFAHYHGFGAAVARGDLPAVIESLEGCERVAAAIDDPVHRGYAETARACFALWQGDLAAAEEAAGAARRSLSDHRSREIGFLVHTSQLYQLRRLQGRLAELAPLLEQGAQAFPELAAFRCARAHLLAQTGRLEEARAALAAFVDRDLARLGWNLNRAVNLALLAECCARVGDAARAAPLLREVEGLGPGHVTLESIVCLGSVRRFRGLLLATRGEPDAALAELEAARADEQRVGARPLEAYAALDCARLHLGRGGRGDREAARERALRARELACAVAMPALASEADAVLGSL